MPGLESLLKYSNNGVVLDGFCEP